VSGSVDCVAALEGLRWRRLFFLSLPSVAKRRPPSNAVFLNDPLRLRAVLLCDGFDEAFSSFKSFAGGTTAASSSTLLLGLLSSFSREGGLPGSPPERRKLSFENMLPETLRRCPDGRGGVMLGIGGGAPVSDVGDEGELQGNFIFSNGGNSSFSSSRSRASLGFSSTTAMVLRRAPLLPG